jgi:hypothetical protein
MTLTPIGSQTRGKNEVSRKSSQVSHIAQNVNENEYQVIDIDGNLGDIRTVKGKSTIYPIPEGK